MMGWNMEKIGFLHVSALSIGLLIFFPSAVSANGAISNEVLKHFEEVVLSKSSDPSDRSSQTVARWDTPINLIISAQLYSEKNRERILQRYALTKSLIVTFQERFPHALNVVTKGKYNFLLILTDDYSKAIKEKVYGKALLAIMSRKKLNYSIKFLIIIQKLYVVEIILAIVMMLLI